MIASVLKPNTTYRMSESKAETSMTPEVNVTILGNHNKITASYDSIYYSFV